MARTPSRDARRPLRLPTLAVAVAFLLAGGAVFVPEYPAAELGATKRASNGDAIRSGTFAAEIRHTYTREDGLPDNDVRGIAVDRVGTVWAATANGLAFFRNDTWKPVDTMSRPVTHLVAHGGGVVAALSDGLYLVTADGLEPSPQLRDKEWDGCEPTCLAAADVVLVGATGGLFAVEDRCLVPCDPLNRMMGARGSIRQIASNEEGHLAVAAEQGLYIRTPDQAWTAVTPRQGTRRWAPHDVRGVAFDERGRLWFASPHGAGVRSGGEWTLYTGHDGLPYNDFTTVAGGRNGAVWMGTSMGAIRWDGDRWEYRMAPRWLPDNDVRQIAVSACGDAWFATPKGVGRIERRPTTLAEKAEFFEREIDTYHRRTPFGFVDAVRLPRPADKSSWKQHDSDNDGLWTAMYGAGECFSYGATGSPAARRRADAAFQALRFLSEVTQGGSHPAPSGFPARSILPTSGPNPNAQHYTPELDQRKQSEDPLWKVITPRWPTSADKKWYWKCDTSSDELDGHYFLNAIYYDMVAETPEQKEQVRNVVRRMTDHLIDHNFELVDHDGRPTRWARYSPAVLNGDILQDERGLNSLSILSYLKVAEHVTGDRKYREAYNTLVQKHYYATNTLHPKQCDGPGTGNQSDDEMAFMCYYNLLNYETDPELRARYLRSLRWYWRVVERECNPLFTFIYLHSDRSPEEAARRSNRFRMYVADAVDALRRLPLDRVMWPYQHSHRLDIERIPAGLARDGGPGGYLRSGKVIPVDERSFEHWNHDPWRLDGGGDGRTLGDGAVFLLPYAMGQYHGFIDEQRETD